MHRFLEFFEYENSKNIEEWKQKMTKSTTPNSSLLTTLHIACNLEQKSVKFF